MMLLSAWYVSRKLGNHPEVCLKPQKAAKHFCWGLAQLLTSLVYSLDAWPQRCSSVSIRQVESQHCACWVVNNVA